GRLFPQRLRGHVDDERNEQAQAADQNLQEAVDVDMVEAVVEDAEYEQPDDGVADAAAAAEQAGAADHDGGDRIEQIGIELVLLRAAEMGDAEHAADPRTDRRDHHHAAEDQLDVEPGIFRRLAIAADHVNVAAEAGIGQHQMAAEQHQRRHDHDPGNA